MGLRLSGGPNVNTTFTCTVGTRQEIVSGIEAALTSAGWTTISGGGTADVLMQSGLTPGGLQFRVRLYDQGSGNCARIFVRSVDGLRAQSTPCYLLPAAGRVFRVIACPYHAFVFTAASVTQGREYTAFGTVWYPAFAGVTEAFWSQGNSANDTSSALMASFRTVLSTGIGAAGNTGTGASCFNGVIWTIPDTANLGMEEGGQRIIVPAGSCLTLGGFQRGYRWQNNAANLSEPLIAWGASADTDEAKIVGQLFDSYVCSQELTADTVKVVGSRNFFVLTSNNIGVVTMQQKGTLMLMVP